MAQKTTGIVRKRRLELGLTQQELADRCAAQGVPVDESHVSRIERGVYAPRPKLRLVLATILDLDVTDFEVSDASASVA